MEFKVNKYKTSKQRLDLADKKPNATKIYIETYGCQMNVADSEVVMSIMIDEGYAITDEVNNADIIFINTCAVRDNAEKRIRNRLIALNALKKRKKCLIIGLLGCMAERLKEKLIKEEQILDIVAGPDSYRSLPGLVKQAESGSKAINVLLSREETYAEISPVRKDKNNVSAFISITRGCDNMCAFCVVPFTRGRERSRNPESILNEVRQVIYDGYKEVILLGQNVDKYDWNKGEVKFSRLLKMTAELDSNIRIRFTTSYPQDFTDEVIQIISEYKNICKYIHLPVQSGSNAMLDKMKRGYTREWYLNRIGAVRRIIPDCSVSTDIITGYCGETEQDHQDTLALMKEVGYDFAYMFKYSERPNTYAARNYEDDVDEETKKRRLNEIIELQQKLSLESNQKDIGKIFEVLVEGISKKSEEQYFGRNTQNKVVVFSREDKKIGDYVNVKINSCTSATLIGEITNIKYQINR
ncbi:MAG: tRNA (N6-isopentenyl adenosine(37)-C2)-methylthiotransferase MiaB [Bacteroidales bacterium]|nr:tRNA (N6-isopentenyl adenosine(37)-C2)-methylthiotransferase MiaB [Bacteroidales bacterium]